MRALSGVLAGVLVMVALALVHWIAGVKVEEPGMAAIIFAAVCVGWIVADEEA